jgi:hypothetical protein
MAMRWHARLNATWLIWRELILIFILKVHFEPTLYILMIEDYPPRDEEGGSPPAKRETSC